MKYLLVGTSPTVLDAMPMIDIADFDCVITSNSGFNLVDPDVYVCIDQVACWMYCGKAKEMQAGGTKLVTLARVESAIKSRGIDFFDEFLQVGEGEPTRDSWGKFQFSGPFAFEYALRNGATSVTVVGCDGYRTGTASDYIESDNSRAIGADRAYRRTMEVIGPSFMRLAELFPEVSIVQIGDPVFDITAENWEVVQCQTS